jgi:hypothetical protein
MQFFQYFNRVDTMQYAVMLKGLLRGCVFRYSLYNSGGIYCFVIKERKANNTKGA